MNKDVKTILDLGCGRGEFGDVFNQNGQFDITGVDIFQPYIDECLKKGRYIRVIKSDLEKINFKDQSFDAVICLQTIEHLPKKKGEKLIKKLERIAKKMVIISVPVGDCEQESYDQNSHQAHLSSWQPAEFVNRSYKVIGVSLKLVYGSYSHAGKEITPLRWIPFLISYLLNPCVYLFPKFAAQMIAVKYVHGFGRIGFNSLPFSYSWIIKRHMDKARTWLDVGCGEGRFMSVVNRHHEYQLTGVDLYRTYLEEAKDLGVYQKLVCQDIRKMKFPSMSFDGVVSSQVIEHLEKTEALKLIKKMESIARKSVVIGTTNGFFPFDPYLREDRNPLQSHKSGWQIKELESLGYKVYGQGLGMIYKPGGLAYRYPVFGILFFSVSYLVSPFTYFFPSISAYLVAVKNAK